MTENDRKHIRYSREVEEILKKKPVFLVRKGILFLVILFLALLVVSHFIQYPERLAASITFESDSVSGNSRTTTGEIILTAAVVTLIRSGQFVAIGLDPTDADSISTLEGRVSTVKPMASGEYYSVTVIHLSRPVLPGKSGKAYILTGESSLLSKIVSPVGSVFRSARRTQR